MHELRIISSKYGRLHSLRYADLFHDRLVGAIVFPSPMCMSVSSRMAKLSWVSNSRRAILLSSGSSPCCKYFMMLAKWLSLFCVCRLISTSPRSPSVAVCCLSPCLLLLLPLLLSLLLLLLFSSEVSWSCGVVLLMLASVRALAASSACCLSPCFARVCMTVIILSGRDASAPNSHCVPTSRTVVSSGFPLVT